jgi:outer membrane lipoprotein-sorting protein
MRLFLFILAYAGTALFAQNAYEIAQKADQLQRGFGDEKTKSSMVLINANGDKVERKMINLTLERKNSQDYSIIQFLNPPDVRGTGLLTHQNPTGDDKQWLYLPDLRRVKKISSKNKSGAFMGSEFTYEDISGNTLDKWTYTFLKEETIEGVLCFLIEKKPKYKNSGYSRVKVWIAKENYLGYRSEFFDRKGALLKVQKIFDWKQYGESWKIGKIQMQNLQTKKQSVLTFEERKINTGLKIKDFSKRSLQRQIKL